MKRVLTDRGWSVVFVVVLIISALVVIWSVFGCEVHREPGKPPTYNVDPNKAAQIEAGVEAGISAVEAFAVLWPGAAGLAGALTLALGAWRKAKKNFEVEQTMTRGYYTTTAALVESIEDFKEAHPSEWKKLKAQLGEMGSKSENVIRAIRGLAPKT